MNSQTLFKDSINLIPGGVHSPVRAFKGLDINPIFFKSAKGAKMTSVEGKDYIDFCQSFGPNILGHRDPDVQAEVEKAINEAWSFSACEPYSLQLAQLMKKNIPWLEKLRFVNSGTEAVMSALRVARAFTKKDKIVKFDGCYHGHVDSMLVQAGSGLAGESESSSAGVNKGMVNNTLVAPLDDIEALNKLFETHKDIAAVIIEPLPANYGLLPQRKEFLQTVKSLCEKNKALLIFDEVISGFRVKFGGMAEDLDMIPDLVTYGKVIGGGFPVGCYGGRSDIMSLIAPVGPVYQAGTLSANPVGMRAGFATLTKALEVNLFEQLETRTKTFCDQLNQIFEKNNTNLRVIQKASLFWIQHKTGNEIRNPSNIPEAQKENFLKMFPYLLSNGIYMAPHAFEVSFMSWAHSDVILSEVLKVFEAYEN